MALVLEPRAVARAGIANVDRLAAFSGVIVQECRFYYRDGRGRPTGCRCAIGFADRGSVLAKLPRSSNSDSVETLYDSGIISCGPGELPVIQFIQHLHDVVVWYGEGTGVISGEILRQDRLVMNFIPNSCVDFIENLALLDKNAYLKVMQLIADG